MRDAIYGLEQAGTEAYVLDLRSNGGGSFPAGVEVARMFLNKGVVVYIADSAGVRDVVEAEVRTPATPFHAPSRRWRRQTRSVRKMITRRSTTRRILFLSAPTTPTPQNKALLKPSTPLTVLVNSGTASAAEVLAGALRDNNRALILGERTFGKGLIQTTVPLSDGSAVNVTVAKYQTPSGIDIHKAR